MVQNIKKKNLLQKCKASSHFEPRADFNAWPLQNYGDYFIEGLRQELCALESRKMHTRSDK